MGVGTATGQILLYDIRSNKPFYTKDHMYNLPIKHIAFHQQQELVLSMDSSVVKIWDRNNVRNFFWFPVFFLYLLQQGVDLSC